jgi:hypothetical protein
VGVRGVMGGAARCSARIERAAHPSPTALQHVRIDHRRTDVLMLQEFLHGPNIVIVLQQVCSKAVSVRLDIMLHLIDQHCFSRACHTGLG